MPADGSTAGRPAKRRPVPRVAADDETSRGPRRPFSDDVDHALDGIDASEEVTAGRVVAHLLDDPTQLELATSLTGLHLEADVGDRATTAQWRTRVQDLYDLPPVWASKHGAIDGRLLVVGLAEIDATLRTALSAGNRLHRLQADVDVLPAVRRPGLEMLADRPLEDDAGDLLGFRVYANALAELIDNPETVTPLTIAISAPWGAGKTSLAHMVEHRLRAWPRQRGEPEHIVTWFNAWMHEDAPHLGAALAAEVAKSANRHRTLVLSALNPLPAAMLDPRSRARRQKVLLGVSVVVVGVAFALGWLPTDLVDTVEIPLLGTVGGAVALVWLLLVLAARLFGAARAAAEFVDSPRSAAATGSMDQVAQQLGRLVQQAVRAHRRSTDHARFVIFVDDLERCSPPRSVEVCEVVSQLFDQPDVVTVLVADMSAIAAAAEIKYQDLSGRYTPRSGLPDGDRAAGRFGQLFLQKMVQFQFDLPTPHPDRTQRLAGTLVDRRPPRRRDPRPDGLRRRLAAAVTRVSDRMQRIEDQTVSSPGGILLWAAGAVLFLALALMRLREGEALFASVLFVVTIANVTTAVTRAQLLRDERRRKDAQRRLAARAREATAAGMGPQELEALLEEEARALRADIDLARQTHRRHIATSTSLRAQAEGAIVEYLPPLPRSAKRMIDRLRFLLVVAWERRMFGGTPRLEPTHLGKWVVLTERWPELEWAIPDDPGLLARMEAADSLTDLAAVLDEARLGVAAHADLHAFLRTEPRLADVCMRLVHFEPAGDAQRAAATASGR